MNYHTVNSDFQKAELKHIFRVLQCISHKCAKPWHLQTTLSNGPCMKYGKWRTEAYSAVPAKSLKWAFATWIVWEGDLQCLTQNLSLRKWRLFLQQDLSLSLFLKIIKINFHPFNTILIFPLFQHFFSSYGTYSSWNHPLVYFYHLFRYYF